MFLAKLLQNFKTDYDFPLLSYKEIIDYLLKVFRQFKVQAIFNILIGIVLVITDLGFVWTTKWAIDIATDPTHSISIVPAIITLIVLILIQLILGESLRWIRAILGVRAQNKMQKDIFHYLLIGNWLEMKKYHTGDLLNRLELDVSTVVKFITENIPAFIRTIVQLVGAFCLLFWMNRQLAIIIIILIPLFLFCSKLLFNKMRKISKALRQTDSKIQSMLQECLQHSMIIKTLQRITTTVSSLERDQSLLSDQIIVKTKYATFSNGILNFGFAIGYIIAFTWGTVSLHRGLITYGALLAFIQLVGQIQGPIKQLTNFIPIFIGAFTSTERLLELLKIPTEKEVTKSELFALSGIKISNVSFSYIKEKYIYKDFSYNFEIGTKTAILGTTGSGKTTLIRLLLSLIEPNKGIIELYDNEGKSTPISPSLRGNFSYVPQGNTLLSGTIRSNLLLGNPKASEKEMWTALSNSCAEFVKKLPLKLDSSCGELGGGLSEGQAQRIAIARALLHPAPILLLDEATSALDEQTEIKVLDNIMKLYKDKTVLIITHRPRALSLCNKQLHLNKFINR